MRIIFRLFVVAIIFALFVIIKELRYPLFSYSSSENNQQHISPLLNAPSPRQRNIFFIDTSCDADGSLLVNKTHEYSATLSVRAACAVEAAARFNPGRPVYLAQTCALQTGSASEPHIQQVLAFPNVRQWQLDLRDLFAGSPLLGLYEEDMKRSVHPVEHLSDLVRLMVLWKYGGTYLDGDLFLVRPLGDLQNFMCSKSPVSVNNAIMDFNLDDVGSPALRALITEIQKTFNPSKYHNGPLHATAAFMKYCGTKRFYQKKVQECQGFKLLNPPYFHPIKMEEWDLMFEEQNAEETMKVINASYGVHAWNHRNKKYPEKNFVKLRSNQPYAQLARQVCPNVVSVAPDVI